MTIRKDNQNKPQQDRTVIVLSSSWVTEPKYFRHAWGRNPLANLKSMDHTDLPFPTLRNDFWTIADMYEIYTGKKSASPNVLDRREQGELTKALRAEDLKRLAGYDQYWTCRRAWIRQGVNRKANSAVPE